jgi:formate/nitrite transporter FocA (FNT family)
MAIADESTRRSAHEIFEEVESNAHQELKRSAKALVFSGIAGGLGMGLTGLGVASAEAVLGHGKWQQFVAMLLFPVGFIAVIIGRAQLFTENTLYPVALILSERKHVINTLRLWIVVFLANIFGAAAFSLLAIKTGALQAPISDALVRLGTAAVQGDASHIFWSGVIGGWLIALMAWIVTASHWTIGQVAIVWVMAFIVGIGHFAHCIASSGEILSAVWAGSVGFGHYLYWLGAATVGNIVGGVMFVTILNFGQVHSN